MPSPDCAQTCAVEKTSQIVRTIYDQTKNQILEYEDNTPRDAVQETAFGPHAAGWVKAHAITQAAHDSCAGGFFGTFSRRPGLRDQTCPGFWWIAGGSSCARSVIGRRSA